MPYGMRGGDTPQSDAWMEKCVTQVQQSGQAKPDAIRICKAAYAKKQAKGA